MSAIRFYFILIVTVSSFACQTAETPKADIPQKLVAIADSFAYPIGKKEVVTQARDGDEWYNAQDFGANDHLGEDWNKNTGGDTDCGEPVYATANGVVTYARDAGPGWGNVITIEHTLPSGEKIESLYGHLQAILRQGG